MDELIQTEHLYFEYGGEEGEETVQVLEDVNLTVPKGEFLAVLGHNGSGKSTLAKHFNAILLPAGGKVWVAGMDTQDEELLFQIRQNVGMVFQNPDNQIVATVVEEDVAFAPENLGVEPDEIRKRVDDALKAVGMYEYREHSPHQLSGGQKQRVAIAGVIAMRPNCIVLDEPTAMLDPKGRREVLKTIHKLNEEYGTTVILITHFMDEAVSADRVVVIDSGKILTQGTPREVFSQVELLKRAGLDVPQVTELAFRLKQARVPIAGDLLTESECLDAIIALLEGSHCRKS